MRHLLSRSAAVFALVLFSSGLAHRPVQGEGQGPDLTIEMRGPEVTGNPRDVRVIIANDGDSWAWPSRVRIETTAPTQGNVLEQDLEDLEVGQSTTVTYTLAEPCNGHRVHVRVDQRDPNADAEIDTDNNDLEQEVCLPAPVSVPGAGPNDIDVLRRPGPVVVADPRPGPVVVAGRPGPVVVPRASSGGGSPPRAPAAGQPHADPSPERRLEGVRAPTLRELRFWRGVRRVGGGLP